MGKAREIVIVLRCQQGFNWTFVKPDLTRRGHLHRLGVVPKHPVALVRRREVLKEFGKRLKATRKMRNEKQQNLADALQLSRTTISNLECGRQRVFLDQVYECAVILDAELTDLLPGVTELRSKSAVTTAPDDPVPRAAQDTAVAVIASIKNELSRADTGQRARRPGQKAHKGPKD